jgi:two-component system chemotaxis response regulator CheB
VDDSSFIRRCVTSALAGDAAIQVVGTAPNGLIALNKLDQLNPDAVVLDIEMPEMDGLETLAVLRRRYPQMVVVMFSTLTERGAAITLKALSMGADDYVAKTISSGGLEQSLDQLRQDLGACIRQFFDTPRPPAAAPAAAPALHLRPPVAVRRPEAPAAPSEAVDVVAIGSSTGGPAALAEVLPLLPASLGVPVFVVQHMPALFTRLLAERLNTSCPLRVREASHGARVQDAGIWIAPGDYHMCVERVTGALRLSLNQAPPENSCRPSVDVLFRSVAELFQSHSLAAVLTGMGRDGQRGSAVLKSVGARVLAQDEESSVVWGMPGAVTEAGLADWVLPLDRIGPHIVQHVGLSNHTSPARSSHVRR